MFQLRLTLSVAFVDAIGFDDFNYSKFPISQSHMSITTKLAPHPAQDDIDRGGVTATIA